MGGWSFLLRYPGFRRVAATPGVKALLSLQESESGPHVKKINTFNIRKKSAAVLCEPRRMKF